MNVFLGTSLIWFGWFGFNGGSAIASSPRAALAAMVTVLGSATGGLFYCFLHFLTTKKWSLEKFCTGAVAGLVIITPASGYVAPWAALVMTILGTLAVRACINLKHHLGFDDTLDAFGIHGVGGVVGSILTGVFADSRIASFDKSEIFGGWINNNYVQVWYQIVATISIAAYSFVISSVLLLAIDRIPGLNLRATENEENLGLDGTLIGEEAYLMNGSESQMAHSSNGGKKAQDMLSVTHESSQETV
jgi:Amt family ammonium transporter